MRSPIPHHPGRHADLALAACRERLHILSDCNPALVWISGSDARCTYVNRAWLEFTGRSLAECLGDGWAGDLHPDDVDAVVRGYRAAFARRESVTLAYRLRRADGVYRWVHDAAAPAYAEDGSFLGYVGSCLDVTEPRQALLDAEANFRLLVDCVEEYAIITVSPDWRVLSWNEGAERMSGYSAAEAVGHDCASFFSPEERAAGFPEKLYRDIERLGHLETEGWLIRKNGTRFLASTTFIALRDQGGKLRGYGKVMRDITERRALENELRDTLVRLKEANGRLHQLSERMLSIQENERRHIARELHDEIGQALTAVKLKLEATLRACPNCRTEIGESVAMSETALERVKGLFLGLRPPQLDDLGLVAAVRWHLDRQAREVGFKADFHADDLPRLKPKLEATCFRVVQEALTNVVRHARAGRVWVDIARCDSELAIEIGDDGRGFDLQAERADEGMGLSGMEERVLLAGGRFVVNSAPGAGTVIRVAIPLEARAAQ